MRSRSSPSWVPSASILPLSSRDSNRAMSCRTQRVVVEREQAALGVLLTLNAPTKATKAMRTEAAFAGFYASPWGGQHPRVQILTVGELLAGKKLDAPPSRQTSLTYKRAPKARKKAETQPGMFGNG